LLVRPLLPDPVRNQNSTEGVRSCFQTLAIKTFFARYYRGTSALGWGGLLVNALMDTLTWTLTLLKFDVVSLRFSKLRDANTGCGRARKWDHCLRGGVGMATDCHPRVTLYLVLNNSKDGKETLKPAVKQVSSGIFKNVTRFVENFKTPF